MVLRRGAGGNACAFRFEKEYSMKKNIQTRHLVFLSLCVCGGMIAKRVVTPVLNPLTDLIRLPGGGAAAAFSLLFIVLGCTVTDWPFAATLSALVQGALAFCLGMTGYMKRSSLSLFLKSPVKCLRIDILPSLSILISLNLPAASKYLIFSV